MVAKSYQKLAIVKDPYIVNGRSYVQVQLRNGNIKQVRWYSESEYQKLYKEKPTDHTKDPYWKSQKEVLGFKNGYITIFKGNTYANKDWFKENGATYRRLWGWSFSSEMELPSSIPEDVKAIRLNWDLVGENDKLKNDTAVQAAIESLMYESSSSQYQGQIGERLTLTLTVNRAIELNGFYGPSTMHIMEDVERNVYVWTTSARKWEENSVHVIRGTVKDHRIYRNTQQTILTRCSEVKKEA